MKVQPLFACLSLTLAILLVCGCDPQPPSQGGGNGGDTNADGNRKPATIQEIMAAASEPDASVQAIEYIAMKPKEEIVLENGQPGYITVQHCLIGFVGTGVNSSLTHDEAKELASDILNRARNGEDFEAMIFEHTDDALPEAGDPAAGKPGVYQMANYDLPGDMLPDRNSDKIFRRDGMVAAFGDVGFTLEVGEYGMSEYDLAKSPYGYHIIKRIK
ncbi:MAG: peptidylprolyl isomerase [Planctomycetota bacterium]